MARWKSFKPIYKANIEEFVTAVFMLKEKFQSLHLAPNTPVGITFKGASVMDSEKMQAAYLSKLKPFLNFTGYNTVIGSNISLELNRSSSFLVERRKSIYKDVEKTRQTSSRQRIGNTYIHQNKTEKYTESVYAGTEATNIHKQIISLALIDDSGLHPLFQLPEYLPHQFFDSEKKSYSISYKEMSRRESWVMALPRLWYCFTCEEY